ncbi:hypothetical protein N8197_01630, partial [bacterium]|nr:hypothetical protein [bacterium]
SQRDSEIAGRMIRNSCPLRSLRTALNSFGTSSHETITGGARMFEGWMFLVTEIWVLLVLAGLLGLFCGWIIWGFGKKGRALNPEDAAVAGKTLPPLEPQAEPGPPALPPGFDLDNTPDDLRRIRGIGPKIEAQCHRLGIYSYAQIAAWTAEDIAHIDAQLRGFEGRASRDDWVSEAKALMVEKGQSQS